MKPTVGKSTLGMILAASGLVGCSSLPGLEGQRAMQAERQTPLAATPLSAPTQAVHDAIRDATREPVASPPRPVETRFNLNVNQAKAHEVFLGMANGTPWSMMVHPDVSGTLTLDLKNVTVPEAMDSIRALYGYDYEIQGRRIIVPSPAVQTRVYHLNYLAMQRKGSSDTRVVSGSVSLSGGGGGGGGEASDSAASASKSLETSSLQTRTDSKYWDEISASLKMLAGESGNVVVSPQSGIIVVRAASANHTMIQKFLQASELAVTRQVMLEAKILEVQLNDGYQSGINWAKLRDDGASYRVAMGANANALGIAGQSIVGSLGTTLSSNIPGAVGSVAGLFGLAFNDGDFASVINLIKSQGVVHVLSSPRIATTNNQKAVLKVGTDDFFVTEISTTTTTSGTSTITTPTISVQPFFSGIALDVTPQIDEGDNVTLHVRPSVSDVRERLKSVNLGDLGVFTLPLASSSISETDSVVRLKNGRIVAIGGLMNQTYDDSQNRIPGLGDLPFLGELFGNTSRASRKRELVVLIKTTLIREDSDWAADTQATQARLENYRLASPGL